MDSIIYCQEGVYIFRKEDKYGLLNDVEEIIVPPVYDNIFTESYSMNNSQELEVSNNFKDGVAKVKKGEFYGYIDSYGKEILECRYNEAYMIDKTLYCVKIGSFWTIVSNDNELKLQLCDDLYRRWYDGNYSIRKSHDVSELTIYKIKNRLGLLCINNAKEIEILTPPIYDEINMERVEACNLYIPVRQSNKWGMINIYGDIILECIYDRLYTWQCTNYSNEWNIAYHKFMTNRTLLNDKEREILYLNDIEVSVIQGGKYGIVSAKGLVIVPSIYNTIEEAEKKKIADSIFPY